MGGMHALQVVCTIHQPSSDICSLFDDAMLLSGVRMCQPAHTFQALHLHRSNGTAIVSSACQVAQERWYCSCIERPSSCGRRALCLN